MRTRYTETAGKDGTKENKKRSFWGDFLKSCVFSVIYGKTIYFCKKKSTPTLSKLGWIYGAEEGTRPFHGLHPRRPLLCSSTASDFGAKNNSPNCFLRSSPSYFQENKSRRSLGYHQFRRNWISSTQSVASHQATGNTAFGWWYTPMAMIYTLKRDDMPSLRLG